MVGCSSLLFFPLVSTSDLYSYIWLPLIFISQSIIPITQSRHLISYLGSHFHFDLYHGHAQSAFRFYIFPDGLALLWKNCYLARLDNRLNFDFLQHPQASLQLPLRIVFPTPNCKIRQGKKKRKTQGEKREKRRRPEPRNKFYYEGSRFVRPQLALSLPSCRISDI